MYWIPSQILIFPPRREWFIDPIGYQPIIKCCREFTLSALTQEQALNLIDFKMCCILSLLPFSFFLEFLIGECIFFKEDFFEKQIKNECLSKEEEWI